MVRSQLAPSSDAGGREGGRAASACSCVPPAAALIVGGESANGATEHFVEHVPTLCLLGGRKKENPRLILPHPDCIMAEKL